MESLDYNYEDFDSRNQNKQDDALLVRFYTKPRQDDVATLEQGRPVFKEREYIDIKIPGQRDGVARPATHADKLRFPRHYAAFKTRTDMPEDGTPLAEWPLIARSLVEELAFFNVKTVESLVDMSDNNAQKFPGINALKAKAVDWLSKASGDAVELRLRSELDEANTKLEEQAKVMDSLVARLDSLEEAE